MRRVATGSRLGKAKSGICPRTVQASRFAFLSILGGYAQACLVTRKKIPQKPKPVNKAEIEAVELVPDAWPKFEKLVKSAAKLEPKPHQDGK